MSMDAAALTVLTALSENAQDSTSSFIQGTGIELPLGFNGFIAPLHPGMDLENVQMTEPSVPVHATVPDSGVSPGDILESLSGRVMDESA